jgi:hypothetical protein
MRSRKSKLNRFQPWMACAVAPASPSPRLNLSSRGSGLTISNVTNLMTAQAAARAREIALRLSVGAGRWRLVQLVLVESALLAFLAAAIGTLFCGRAAPFVVNTLNPPDNPARQLLSTDWCVVGMRRWASNSRLARAEN